MRYNYYDDVDYSPVFDSEYYLSFNPDVKEAFGDDWYLALKHFVYHGMSEGRVAKKDFQVQAYRANYPDLEKAFGDDWAAYFRHYLEHGIYEGRTLTRPSGSENDPTVLLPESMLSSPIFVAGYYLDSYPDLKNAFGNNTVLARDHFLTMGMKEARQACDNFNPVYYRKKYEDLNDAFGDDWVMYYWHYLVSGFVENRDAAPIKMYDETVDSYGFVPSLDRNFTYVSSGFDGRPGFYVSDPADINALCNVIESIAVISIERNQPDAVITGGYSFTLGSLACSMTSDILDLGSKGYFRMADADGFWKIRNVLEALQAKYE